MYIYSKLNMHFSEDFLHLYRLLASDRLLNHIPVESHISYTYPDLTLLTYTKDFFDSRPLVSMKNIFFLL